jgi:VanZ family protein
VNQFSSDDQTSALREWFWPAALALVIFFASGQSQVAAPDISGFDKLAHFAVYGLLATLLVRISALVESTPLDVWIAVLIASAYGLSDEFHQSFTPGRAVELLDWTVDTLGAALAVLMYSRWSSYRYWLEAPLRRQRVETGARIVPQSIS